MHRYYITFRRGNFDGKFSVFYNAFCSFAAHINNPKITEKWMISIEVIPKDTYYSRMCP